MKNPFNRKNLIPILCLTAAVLIVAIVLVLILRGCAKDSGDSETTSSGVTTAAVSGSSGDETIPGETVSDSSNETSDQAASSVENIESPTDATTGAGTTSSSGGKGTNSTTKGNGKNTDSSDPSATTTKAGNSTDSTTKGSGNGGSASTTPSEKNPTSSGNGTDPNEGEIISVIDPTSESGNSGSGSNSSSSNSTEATKEPTNATQETKGEAIELPFVPIEDL